MLMPARNVINRTHYQHKGENMDAIKKRFLRACRKPLDIFPVAWVQATLVMFAGALLSLLSFEIIGYSPTDSTPSYLACAYIYFTFSGIWLITLLVILLFPSNRPMIKKLLLTIHEGNTILRALLGLITGFVLIAIATGISVFRQDIALSFVAIEPKPLLIIFAAVLIQSGAEEIVFRLYLFQKLRRRYKSAIFAIIISALAFAQGHMGNTGISPIALAQITVFGIVFAVLVNYFDALGAAIGFHTGWNYAQNIIFGLPNSGLVSQYSIFKIEAAANGPFFNTIFGIEGSVGAVAMLSIVLLILVVIVAAKQLKSYDLWEKAEAQALEQAGGSSAQSSGPRHLG